MSAQVAPHNIDAEQGLLGAILINNDALGVVDRLIEPEHFFEPIHQKIYAAARDTIRAGKLVNPPILKGCLPANLEIAGLTPSRYLARLCAQATPVINAPDHARVIRDPESRRALAQARREGLVFVGRLA